MKKLFILTLAAGALLADNLPIGVVDFMKCAENSKVGQAEIKSLEEMREQLEMTLKKLDDDRQKIENQLSDQDNLDSLNEEAQKKMQEEYQMISQAIVQYQNQYFQLMNQKGMKVQQTLNAKVTEAAQTVAQARKLQAIVNKEVCFYYLPAFDVTPDVIVEMDKRYVADQPATPPAAPVK